MAALEVVASGAARAAAASAATGEVRSLPSLWAWTSSALHADRTLAPLCSSQASSRVVETPATAPEPAAAATAATRGTSPFSPSLWGATGAGGGVSARVEQRQQLGGSKGVREHGADQPRRSSLWPPRPRAHGKVSAQGLTLPWACLFPPLLCPPLRPFFLPSSRPLAFHSFLPSFTTNPRDSSPLPLSPPAVPLTIASSPRAPSRSFSLFPLAQGRRHRLPGWRLQRAARRRRTPAAIERLRRRRIRRRPSAFRRTARRRLQARVRRRQQQRRRRRRLRPRREAPALLGRRARRSRPTNGRPLPTPPLVVPRRGCLLPCTVRPTPLGSVSMLISSQRNRARGPAVASESRRASGRQRLAGH